MLNLCNICCKNLIVFRQDLHNALGEYTAQVHFNIGKYSSLLHYITLYQSTKEKKNEKLGQDEGRP